MIHFIAALFITSGLGIAIYLATHNDVGGAP